MRSFQYCVNLCRVVTSERNCVCNPCGASVISHHTAHATGGNKYASIQVLDLKTGETCQAR